MGRKAFDEARRLGRCPCRLASIHASTPKDNVSSTTYRCTASIPSHARPRSSTTCENETIDGVQFSPIQGSHVLPFKLCRASPTAPPPVGDTRPRSCPARSRILANMPSSLRRAEDVGPAGLTILIVRQDVSSTSTQRPSSAAIPVPLCLSYTYARAEQELHKTLRRCYPSTSPGSSSIYERTGGLAHYEVVNRRKAEKVYAAIRAGEERGCSRAGRNSGSGTG